jgi:hypothetical protein
MLRFSREDDIISIVYTEDEVTTLLRNIGTNKQTSGCNITEDLSIRK